MKPQYHLVDNNANVLLTVNADNFRDAIDPIKAEVSEVLGNNPCTPIDLCLANMSLLTWDPSSVSEMQELSVLGMSVVHNPVVGFKVESYKVLDL